MLEFAFVALALPLLVLLVAAAVGLGHWRFQHTVRADLDALAAGSPDASARTITEDDLDGLPPIVCTWLWRSGVVGRPAARTVRLRQTGAMQTSREGRWMPFEAQQWFTTESPGFVWTVDVKAAPGVHLAGRDKYIDGRGHMLIRLLSVFSVADADGPNIDQGTLVRYLAETVWFPSAALEPYITWEGITERSARATMAYGGVTASGVFTFDERGDLVSFEAKRYRDDALEDWLVEAQADGCAQFGPLRAPARLRVTWKLADGDWTWLELEVHGIDLDAQLEGAQLHDRVVGEPRPGGPRRRDAV